MDGEISFVSKDARTADEACAQLARRYGKDSFEAFCEAADYAPGSFRIAEVKAEPKREESEVQIVGPPTGLAEKAFLLMRGAMRR
ncbi:MAG: hypothetical protein IPO61_16735 [Gammaproteobacteria bacterium]|nr:hypothetical protein [Gammaproteobacteria bacterium]